MTNTLKTQDKLTQFAQELSEICKNSKIVVDVLSSSEKSPLVFYSSFYSSKKRLTLKELLNNQVKYADFVNGLNSLFTKHSYIIDTGDYNDGCPMVVRKLENRSLVGILSYDLTEDENFIKYVCVKKQ